MFHSRNTHSVMDVVDPPRDGEFFFEEISAEESREKQRWTQVIGRHPAWAIGMAAFLGMLIGSILLRF